MHEGTPNALLPSLVHQCPPHSAVLPQEENSRYITEVLKPTQGVSQFVLDVTQKLLVLGLN